MKRTSVFLGALVLASCGGGGGSPSTPMSSAASASRATVPVKITFALPRAGRSRVRHAMYVSANTSSISVDVTPSGGTTSSYTGTCVSGSCTVAFASVPGATTLGIKLYDSGGDVLSRSTTAVIIVASIQNNIALTANPVVASADLQIASATVVAGAPSDVSAAFTARDASGAIIIGADAYVDAAGSAVSFTVTPSNIQAGGNGSIAPVPASPLTAPPAAALTLHYDGGWLDHTDVSITSSSAMITALTGGTVATVPQTYVYSTGLPPGSSPSGPTAGPDGNIWFTDVSLGSIIKMSTSGVVIANLPSQFSPGWVGGVCATGADGKIYYLAYNQGVGRITAGGTVEPLPAVSGYGATEIARGADGNIYFTEESGYLGKVTPAGPLTEFPLTGASNPRGVGVGLDGNLWVISSGTQTLSRVTPTGVETDYAYTIPWAAGGFSDDNNGVLTGPDGKIWFITPDEQGVGMYDIGAGTFSFYHVSGSAFLTDLAIGPDHNVWFVDSSGNRVGRITPGGTVTQFPLGSSGNPYMFTFGSDGNIWASTGNAALKFVL